MSKSVKEGPVKVAESEMVEARYQPPASNPNPRTIRLWDGDGKLYQAKLIPRKWVKIPVVIAEHLKAKLKRMARGITVPDGENLEQRMFVSGNPGAESEEGFMKWDVVFKD